MSTCHWCLSVNGGVAELLQEYCAGSLSAEVEKEVSEDLKFCSDCVEAYHREKENVPGLHGRLWKLETSRLLRAFSDAEKGALSDNDLICVDEDGCEAGVPDLNPAQYAYDLTVPMFEVLKYPYLLAHPELSEMCVRAICKMAEYDSFVVTDKYAGIYLLLVHPNETVRRWAIEAAKSLGKVDRDDFYDFQDIFSCMFYIVELGIPQNLADMDMPYNPMTKMTWLPPHLYDSSNAKNYWLGICMLLTQLDAQAMDSLFLGPDKQANILNCILNTIEKDTDDEEMDPFWPVLRCFMVILDCLGSRIWGQIEPSQAFQAITGSPSYIAIKTESVNDDDMVTCSQMVYNSSTNVSQVIISNPVYCPDSSVMYEEMNSLVNLMNSDMGLPFSVKDSTFLWFIPFVKSVMDLDDRSVIYIGEVVHFLCGGISTDPLNRNVCISDKVAEFFALILIHIIELHKESDRMNMLYYCAPKWVGVLVKCATLPVEAFVHTSEGSASHSVSSTSSRVRAPRKVSTSRTVPQACIKIIRSLLKEGSRINPNSKCNEFLNLVNKQLREGPQKEWKLNRSEIQDLQSCLKNYVKMIVNRPTTNAPPPEPLKIVGPKPTTTPPLQSSDEDSGSSGIAELKHTLKHEAPWDCNEGLTSDLRDSNGVWTGRDLKEEKETEGFVELNNDSRPTRAIVSSLKTSQCKIQEIKSRLGSLMTKKSNSERDGPGTTFAQDKPQSVLSSGRDEVEMPADPSCAQEESFDNEELDDLPLSILRTTFIRNKVSKSGKRHTEHIDQSPPQSPSGIIVISDEDDDAVQTGLCFSDTSKIKHEHEPIDASGQNHSPLRDYDGDMSESQVFEFETLEDMASAWSDQGSGSKIISERTQKDSPVRPTVLTVSTTSGVLDTQPVSDDDIERACQQVEELEKLKTPTQECKRGIVKKRDLLVDAKPLRSKCLSEKSKLVKKQAKEGLPALRKSNSKLCLNRLETKMPSSLTTSLTSAISHKTSIPAIVPPKKVRKAIVPASTAERLGLKKKERKAFDLSQRTLDSLDELRRYGASVNVPQTKKSTRQTKRSKVTSPQKRVVSVSNKKLLASQECQFFRQSKQASGGRTSANVPKKRDPINSEENLRPSFVTAEEDEDEDLPCSQPDPVSPVETLNATCSLQKKDPQADSTPASSVSSSMNSFVSPYFQSNYEVTPGPSDQDTRKEEKGAGDDDEDSDWMHLTQMEPTDMEICSQMEGENFFHPQPDPVDLDSDKQVPFQEIAGLSDWTRPVQATDNGPETPLVPQSFKKPTTSPPSVTRLDQEDDRLFLKPGMSPISLKKAKPSTTKIYATSKSRNASLAQEMENTAKAKCLSASTPAGRGRPARSVGCAQNVPEPSQTIFRKPFPPKERLYRPIASQKPPPKPIPPPQQPPPRPPQNVPHPPGQPILPIQHCNIGSTPQPSTSKTCPRPDALVHRQIPNQDVGFRYDPNYLIQGILSWTFDMFSNYKQFGLPSEICELPLETVGLNFNSYDEYYNTFYPVLLTNAFEEVNVLFLCRPAGQSPTLNLTIRILGNVSLVNQQMVRCDVVGSLVSTMREFKAICRLRNCSMRRPLLSPQAPFFQSGPEVIPSLPGYNSDQVRAVKTAMSIIRNRLNNPKICLIHGPPGTGKSKTIVGLLQNLFHEVCGVNMQAKSRQMRVLVCAPSNAAIDSLMKKIIVVFKEKCKNVQGNCGYINLVRLGNDRTISESMKPFSLDNQVKSRIGKSGEHSRYYLGLNEGVLKSPWGKGRDLALGLLDLPPCIHLLLQTRSAKQVTQTQVLIDAHVICCTLSTSGSSLLESAFRRLGHEPFGCVIVDEAGQATETETLIPMLYRCNALVLVGDPNQLPPTVISQRAKELNYGQSLMARLVTVLDNSSKDNNIPSPVIFLSNQYRMHPDICRFPSKHVYHNALKTDNETAERRVNLSWPFQPYQVFDVTDGQEVKERDLHCKCYKNPLLFLISPLGPRVEVDTVDGFQGREMDCIIVSCVRASHEQGNIGFLGNRQRLNVTITRAKCSLFILGHLRTLRENNEWGALIKDAATRDVIIQTNEMTFKADAMKIFKQDRPRSLSHLPREPVPPRPAAASCRAAPPSMRRSTHPAPVFHARDSAPQRRPSSLSPPQATETRDPRLMVQHPQAPQHRPEWDSRAEVRRDPRLERLRDPQFERDPRGRSSPEQYPQAGYQDNRRWADRERRHSPASTSYPRDRVGRPLRDPRQTDSYRYGATASSNHHTHTQKRPTDQQWIPPTDAKRAKR
uniref:Senataxin n=1 Tax=Esox lucius TaxID=8010 RepID=A0AAY5KHP1_ESOLU